MAHRATMSFAEFEEQFINSPDNFLPVYTSIKEDDDGIFRPAVVMEMVVSYRLMDGKILFLTVNCDTKEQLTTVLDWARKAALRLGEEASEYARRCETGYMKHIQW